MAVNHTSEEILAFKLGARLRKLQRDLETEMMQKNLFPSISDKIKAELLYDIQRLQNRLQRITENI